MGNAQETFFVNQLGYQHKIRYAEQGDFFVDENLFFEIGGKNKKSKQIASLENAFTVIDDIEYGYKNKIPLWLFGFIY